MGARFVFALVIAAGAAIVPAAPAAAAVASTHTVCEFNGKGCTKRIYVKYTAAPEEENVVSLKSDATGVTISDRVAIGARGKCVQRTPTRVRCSGQDVTANLGDGDDTVEGTSASTLVQVSIHGGPGNDSLTGHGVVNAYGDEGTDVVTARSADGGDGNDLVIGTDEDDYLRGGPGEDTLYGAEGDDNLNGDGGPEAAHDVLRGGPGADVASYSGRTERVEVDLWMHIGGYPGESDELDGIEGAIGGAGPDYLVGDDGPNRLDGGTDCRQGDPGTPGDVLFGSSGDDQLRGSCRHNSLYGGAGDDQVNAGGRGDLLDGGPGDDLLGGGFGVDRFQGGDGADTIVPSHTAVVGARREHVWCGPGGDVVLEPGYALVHNDCESVNLSFGLVTGAYPKRPRPSELDFTIRCPRPRLCSGSLALTLRGERHPFRTAKFRRRNGVAHLRLLLPERVTNRTDASVPIRATLLYRQKQRPYADPDFSGFWVFDLAETTP